MEYSGSSLLKGSWGPVMMGINGLVSVGRFSEVCALMKHVTFRGMWAEKVRGRDWKRHRRAFRVAAAP